MSDEQPVMSTDRELYRAPAEPGMEYYAHSIYVNEQGGIGIDVGGIVFVRTLEIWHALAAAELARTNPELIKSMGALSYQHLLQPQAIAALPPQVSPELIEKLGKLATYLTEQGEYEACDLIDTVVERVTKGTGQ